MCARLTQYSYDHVQRAKSTNFKIDEAIIDVSLSTDTLHLSFGSWLALGHAYAHRMGLKIWNTTRIYYGAKGNIFILYQVLVCAHTVPTNSYLLQYVVPIYSIDSNL